MLVDPGMIVMLSELRMPGQPDPVGEILEVFEQDGRQVILWIAKAHADGDAEALRRAAHRLKGAAATVGASELALVLEKVEKSARVGEMSAVAAEVARVPHLFRDSVLALQALR